MSIAQQSTVTAAILIIGDEILSGRTQDGHVHTIANFLAPLGISIAEVRMVMDDQDAIVEALNILRARNTYVLTTGGIGPTHDDITADAVAAAFGVPIGERADALALLAQRYGADQLNDARRRMARIPEGAQLIANPISSAPGFQLANVFVMAGVPAIMRAMLDDVGPRLTGGSVVITRTWRATGLREGLVGTPLGELAARHKTVTIGSYPWTWTDGFGANLVIRGTELGAVEAAAEAVRALIVDCGCVPEAV